MKKRNSNLTRAEFLRLMGLSSLGLFFPYRFNHSRRGITETPDKENDFIKKLFAESLVFDGCGSLGLKRGKGYVSLLPGEIKRLTGIDVATKGVRVDRLAEQNSWVESHSDAFLKIERASDIETAKKTNLFGLIYYIQRGFDLKGSIEPLAKWKEGGLRSLQITYGDNELGGGSRSDDMPLTELGKKVVKELNRLRMVVDVSHCGKRTTLDVIQVATQPLTANHANAWRLSSHGRNKSDEELEGIAGTGGVVGVTTIGRFLLRDPSRPATMDDFVAHVDYLVEKIGIDHVGIAGDCYLDGEQVYDVDFSDNLINSYDRWKHLAHRLHNKGYSKKDLQKILGLNFKRVFEQVLDP